MKGLAISNIGWTKEQDDRMYGAMREAGFAGLEVAPTRIVPKDPYLHLEESLSWKRKLQDRWGFALPSMQSIWFGRQELLFGSKEERTALLAYTQKAIDYAAAMDCRNLVFGCPKNRNIPDGMEEAEWKEIACEFFGAIGRYAAERGRVIGLEANPPMYHTNFLNETSQAFVFAEALGTPGIGVNLDLGTMIANGESAQELRGRVSLISHVHISEPGLEQVQERTLHRKVLHLLQEEGYQGYLSIEMKTTDPERQEQAMACLTREASG